MPIDLASRDGAPPDQPNWIPAAGSSIAWFALGMADVLITWRACIQQQLFGDASSHPAARVLYLAISCVLLGTAAIAGVSSYRNWMKLSGRNALLRAEAPERSEFIALTGLFMSFTLGFGMVWLCLPLFIIPMCIRAR